MIITMLAGGLGNQLFQYAFARILAERHQTQLYLDKTFYFENDHRYFELDNFKVRFDGLLCFDSYREAEEIATMHGIPICVVDSGTDSIDEITRLGPNIVLEGEWSSSNAYLFEKRNRLLISEEIQLNGVIGHDLLRRRIEQSQNAVFVHVRRGDYCVNRNVFQLLSEDYYTDAFNFIRQNVPDPEFFIFSDEIDRVKKDLQFPGNVNYIDNISSTHDLMLARQCKHFICANSTYSWWAAYLGEKKDSIVVFPKDYYTGDVFQNWYEASTEYLKHSWLRR